MFVKKKQKKNNNSPNLWQLLLSSDSGDSVVLICVLFVRPSASCCDIQTELCVISLGDLLLPHERWLISSGGGGGSPGGPAARIPAPEGVHRPATAAPASLVSQTGGCLAADLQMTWVGLVGSEAERGGGLTTAGRSHGSLLRRIIQPVGQKATGRRSH